MRIWDLAVLPALALAATLAAAPASADTLFTNPSRLTAVAPGTIASITSGTVTAKTGSTPVNACRTSTLSLKVEQNDATAVAGTLTAGVFSNCALSAAGDFPWRFTVRGSGTTTGSTTFYPNATWENVSATLWGVSPGDGTLTDATATPGTAPVDGLYVRQTATGSRICFVLNNAGTLSGPLLSDGKIDATYCLEGEAASTWTLGIPPIPPPTGTGLFVDPANTTVPSSGTVTYRGSTGATVTLAGLGSVQCSSAVSDFTVGGSGGTEVNGALNIFTLTSCTDTVPGLTITSCARVPTTVTLVALRATGPAGGREALSNVYVKCALTGMMQSCYYAAPSATGTVTNTPSVTTFSGVGFTHGVPPAGATDDLGAACGGNGTLSTTFTDFANAATATTVTLRTL